MLEGTGRFFGWIMALSSVLNDEPKESSKKGAIVGSIFLVVIIAVIAFLIKNRKNISFEIGSTAESNNDNYDKKWRNIDGYDEEGYDKDGYSEYVPSNAWLAKPEIISRDRGGYDRDGYDEDGYDRQGYDRQGFNRNGRDRGGYDRDGYDIYGHDRDGYSKSDKRKWLDD